MVGIGKAHRLLIFTSGVLGCFGGPLSPNTILPDPSSAKHMEKEFCATPCLAMVLGTEISASPSPRSPSEAEEPCTKPPVWFVPHLHAAKSIVQHQDIA